MADLAENKLFYRNNPAKPLCSRCRLFPEICICAEIPQITNKNRISLYLHAKELERLTNTGRLLGLCLANFSLSVKGLQDNIFDSQNLLADGYTNYILHPAASKSLSDIDLHSDLPINLIVPDGSWRQSNRLLRSEPLLHNIPRVRLPDNYESNYILRRESEAGHLSTFEAVAKALGFLENADMEAEMLLFFNIFVNRLLARANRL